MKKFLSILLITIAAGGSSAVWAKGRWYQVEVIVFRYTDAGAVGGEQWPGLESSPDFRNAVELFVDLPEFSDEPSASGSNTVATPGPLAFQSLPASALKMTGVYRRLRSLGTYDPVLHVGWRQPGLGGSRARNVYVSSRPAARMDAAVDSTVVDLQPPANIGRIEGTIRVTSGRLLYVAADFVSHGREAPVRIVEQRKVKLKELHYFDHPLFGVIVQVTPYRIAELVDQSGQTPEPESVEDQ